MSAWAPTRASSVSPPVSVARLISDRAGCRGAPDSPPPVCDAGSHPGSLSGRIVPPRPEPHTGLVPAGTTTSLECPVHLTVKRLCGVRHIDATRRGQFVTETKGAPWSPAMAPPATRSEEHTSELQ